MFNDEIFIKENFKVDDSHSKIRGFVCAYDENDNLVFAKENMIVESGRRYILNNGIGDQDSVNNIKYAFLSNNENMVTASDTLSDMGTLLKTDQKIPSNFYNDDTFSNFKINADNLILINNQIGIHKLEEDEYNVEYFINNNWEDDWVFNRVAGTLNKDYEVSLEPGLKIIYGNKIYTCYLNDNRDKTTTFRFIRYDSGAIDNEVELDPGSSSQNVRFASDIYVYERNATKLNKTGLEHDLVDGDIIYYKNSQIENFYIWVSTESKFFEWSSDGITNDNSELVIPNDKDSVEIYLFEDFIYKKDKLYKSVTLQIPEVSTDYANFNDLKNNENTHKIRYNNTYYYISGIKDNEEKFLTESDSLGDNNYFSYIRDTEELVLKSLIIFNSGDAIEANTLGLVVNDGTNDILFSRVTFPTYYKSVEQRLTFRYYIYF